MSLHVEQRFSSVFRVYVSFHVLNHAIELYLSAYSCRCFFFLISSKQEMSLSVHLNVVHSRIGYSRNEKHEAMAQI